MISGAVRRSSAEVQIITANVSPPSGERIGEVFRRRARDSLQTKTPSRVTECSEGIELDPSKCAAPTGRAGCGSTYGEAFEDEFLVGSPVQQLEMVGALPAVDADQTEIEPLMRVVGVNNGSIVREVRAEQTFVANLPCELRRGNFVFEIDAEVVVSVKRTLAIRPIDAAELGAVLKKFVVRRRRNPRNAAILIQQCSGSDDIARGVKLDNERRHGEAQDHYIQNSRIIRSCCGRGSILVTLTHGQI
jgi:hypothetical protein